MRQQRQNFFDEYLEKLKELTDVTKIDYLVVSHTEPDHAGSVEKLLEINPGMKIIATGCAVNFLKEIVNGEFTRYRGKRQSGNENRR